MSLSVTTCYYQFVGVLVTSLSQAIRVRSFFQGVLRVLDSFNCDIRNAAGAASRTRVAAVKEKRPIVIQWNLAALIALYRT